tara:strand:+ start:46 stop:288 length:243 start_codon:yes stop_codon:yes gene_type:complete
MTKKEQNLVVEKMHQRVQNADVDQLVQPVRITKEERVNPAKRKKDEPELFQKKRTRDYMDGLKGGANYELGRCTQKRSMY